MEVEFLFVRLLESFGISWQAKQVLRRYMRIHSERDVYDF